MGTELEALFPATRRALLVGFFRRPDQRFYLRQIVRLVGKGQGAVQREIRSLMEAGIIERIDESGRSFYRANANSPIFSELHGLIEKTAGLAVVLERALEGLPIRLAFVFGSVARAEQRSHSDIDLAIVGDVSFRQVVGALAPPQKQLAREINPIVYSEAELSGKLKRGEHFVTELSNGPKIFLIGTADDLEAMGR